MILAAQAPGRNAARVEMKLTQPRSVRKRKSRAPFEGIGPQGSQHRVEPRDCTTEARPCTLAHANTLPFAAFVLTGCPDDKDKRTHNASQVTCRQLCS